MFEYCIADDVQHSNTIINQKWPASKSEGVAVKLLQLGPEGDIETRKQISNIALNQRDIQKCIVRFEVLTMMPNVATLSTSTDILQELYKLW